MAGSDENHPGVIGPVNVQGGLPAGVGKFTTATGNNRRALSNINRNIIGAPPYPCAVNKRGLSEKFAAQLANKQPEETKKPDISVPISSESEDCSIIDVEHYKSTGDFSVPMFVQHTEAMLEEIDRMDEVEMEDVVEEPFVDIDSCDKKNPLTIVEYIGDLYTFYKKTERSSCAPPSYMAQQFDINERMRGILIDWLIEVHYKFELMDETLYLTVNLIDRFLAVHSVVRKKLQLVGVTAMLLACKYEEVSVPVVEDLILISDKAYSRKEVLDMLELLSFFIIELCLVEYEMLKFPPSLLAAAAIYTAQCTLSGSRQWSKTNEWYASYSEEQLLECSRLMVNFHQNAATGKLTGVHRKYSTSKFGYAAKTEPANFLLDSRF
ncbi:hypothetical protein GH714_007191 [Hevea brasiliensis]|uniref:B-like cyclin n=1 Tax=Hevea brasiliensis TaxID=3981 RepID=A0A6A6M8X4_HEVBR|nr:hypothetical protein GH714_007191 [Hevea brasiliensis]